MNDTVGRHRAPLDDAPHPSPELTPMTFLASSDGELGTPPALPSLDGDIGPASNVHGEMSPLPPPPLPAIADAVRPWGSDGEEMIEEIMPPPPPVLDLDVSTQLPVDDEPPAAMPTLATEPTLRLVQPDEPRPTTGPVLPSEFPPAARRDEHRLPKPVPEQRNDDDAFGLLAVDVEVTMAEMREVRERLIGQVAGRRSAELSAEVRPRLLAELKLSRLWLSLVEDWVEGAWRFVPKGP